MIREIMPYGDRALLVNFDRRIDLDVHRAVIQLTRHLQGSDLPGISFCIPAYCSLTIGYDPLILDEAVLKSQLLDLDFSDDGDESPGRRFRIPVCYDPEYALDMESVQEQTGLPPEKIIALHVEQEYHVYMLGFRPGFVYLGKVNADLATRRKEIPRKRVPPLSVGLAGLQTGIYPSPAPGGWQIIGRTPAPTFIPTAEDPFVLRSGDRVRFYQISRAEFEKWWSAPDRFKLQPDA